MKFLYLQGVSGSEVKRAGNLEKLVFSSRFLVFPGHSYFFPPYPINNNFIVQIWGVTPIFFWGGRG